MKKFDLGQTIYRICSNKADQNKVVRIEEVRVSVLNPNGEVSAHEPYYEYYINDSQGRLIKVNDYEWCGSKEELFNKLFN